MMMDAKETLMLKHYKNLIENQSFDEYDILGFLIFIRRHIDGKCEYTYLQEFADLIAHRERDQGLIFNSIKAAAKNSYQTRKDGRKVVGYNGISYQTWVMQWKELGKNYQILIDPSIVKEITLCVFSLAQHTQYDDKNGYAGKIDIFQGKDNSLAMATSEQSPSSLFVCFMKSGKYDFIRTLPAGYLKKPVETIRENGKLRLKDEDGYII